MKYDYRYKVEKLSYYVKYFFKLNDSSLDADGKPLAKIKIDKTFKHLFQGYSHTIRVLAKEGNNVISDLIITEKEQMKVLKKVLKKMVHPVNEDL